MRRYSRGKISMLILWVLAVIIIQQLPYNINDYLEVVMLIVALISIPIFGERIDRIIIRARR